MEYQVSYWIISSLAISLGLILLSIATLFSKNQLDVSGKTVLLTGASEGMGLSVAKTLAHKGANIIIVARNVVKLEGALAQVKAAAVKPSQRFQYISADVSAADGAHRVITEAMAWNNGHSPDMVWCIAGSAFPGLFIDTPRGVMRQQMEINYWSCVDMAQAILQQWLSPNATRTGHTKHLIFTSSVVAFYPVAGYAPYAPSKAAIKSLSDTLVQEMLLYGDDVKIHTVFPGTIQSPGLERENSTKPEITHILEESDPVQTPDIVAAKAIAGLERGDYLVTVGFLGNAMRACAWGGSRRNNWLLDTALTWIVSLVWYFVGLDMDGKIKNYREKNGRPGVSKKE